MRYLLLFVFLAGCCTPCKPLVTKCPAPPADAFVRPKLAIFKLTPGSKAGDVIQAYFLSVGALQDHVFYLEGILRGYR